MLQILLDYIYYFLYLLSGFAYSTAHDSIVELGSVEEYESCDLSNPIRMYTDGVDKISLDGEGIRYFASGNIENCKKGLKLPVNVQLHVNGPTSAASPLGYWPRFAESPIIDRTSLETKQAQSPSMGCEYGPTTSLSSAESPIVAGSDGPISSFGLYSYNGLPINEMFSQKKWAKRLSEKEADGPISLSAPINLSGLFGLWAVGLLLHVISYY